MRPGARKDDQSTLAQIINQQKVTADVAFTEAFPIAGQFVIEIFRWQWSVVGDEQQHRLLQSPHVVAPRMTEPLPVLSELACFIDVSWLTCALLLRRLFRGHGRVPVRNQSALDRSNGPPSSPPPSRHWASWPQRVGPGERRLAAGKD